MSDSQRFPVAAHTLAYLAHRNAFSREQAVSSSVLAASIPTNPVVIRRMTTQLAKAGLLATCSGVAGGAWLLRRPENICLDEVLRAVNGCAHLGSAPVGAEGCPVSQAIPRQINAAMKMADAAACRSLATVTVADLLKDVVGVTETDKPMAVPA
jgi:DNA-binding IscR family transcriptional regulator